MADRTSAALFADIFEYLAACPDERSKRMAEDMWRKTSGYDFHPCQMGCDEALRRLGLLHDRDDQERSYGPKAEAGREVRGG